LTGSLAAYEDTYQGSGNDVKDCGVAETKDAVVRYICPASSPTGCSFTADTNFAETTVDTSLMFYMDDLNGDCNKVTCNDDVPRLDAACGTKAASFCATLENTVPAGQQGIIIVTGAAGADTGSGTFKLVVTPQR
jgi:hypothetical protein